MKAFRGSLLAAAVLLLVGVLVFMLRPEPVDKDAVEGVRIFEFEKHELTRVHVERPGADPITLVERDGQWTIDGTGFVAGRSMVNRVKHQLHDLTSRATVVEDPDQPELYGTVESWPSRRGTPTPARSATTSAPSPATWSTPSRSRRSTTTA